MIGKLSHQSRGPWPHKIPVILPNLEVYEDEKNLKSDKLNYMEVKGLFVE